MKRDPKTAGSLSDVAVFELVDVASSVRLAERLARHWHVTISAERGNVIIILARLRKEPEDLARLLREVESWVSEEALCAIGFELDGRAYVLAGKSS